MLSVSVCEWRLHDIISLNKDMALTCNTPTQQDSDPRVAITHKTLHYWPHWQMTMTWQEKAKSEAHPLISPSQSQALYRASAKPQQLGSICIRICRTQNCATQSILNIPKSKAIIIPQLRWMTVCLWNKTILIWYKFLISHLFLL